MRPAFRRAAIVALVVAFLAPGLIHARPFDGSMGAISAASDVSRDGGFFSMVWNLLAKLWSERGVGAAGSPTVAKDAAPPVSTTAATPPPPPDNGGHLDPSG
jgi:hypothetical protein